MRLFWFIPLGILALGAGVLLRSRLRASRERSFTHEPVSGQWLAERRSRDEPPW